MKRICPFMEKKENEQCCTKIYPVTLMKSF